MIEQNRFIDLNLFKILNIVCNNKGETKLMYYLLKNSINNEISENQEVICKNIFVSVSTLNRIIKRLKNKNWIKINVIFKNNKKFSNIKISNNFYKDFYKISKKLDNFFSDFITPKNTKTMEIDNKKIGCTNNPDPQKELEQIVKMTIYSSESLTDKDSSVKKEREYPSFEVFEMPNNQDVRKMTPEQIVKLIRDLCNFYINKDLVGSQETEGATLQPSPLKSLTGQAFPEDENVNSLQNEFTQISKNQDVRKIAENEPDDCHFENVPDFQQDFSKEKESSKEKEIIIKYKSSSIINNNIKKNPPIIPPNENHDFCENGISPETVRSTNTEPGENPDNDFFQDGIFENPIRSTDSETEKFGIAKKSAGNDDCKKAPPLPPPVSESSISELQEGLQTLKPVTAKKTKSKNQTLTFEEAMNLCPDKIKNLEGFTEVWSDWMHYRSEIHKPITKTTAKYQFKQLLAFYEENELQNPIEIINTSITNSWVGLFRLNLKNYNPQKSQVPKKEIFDEEHNFSVHPELSQYETEYSDEYKKKLGLL